jgi:3-mercaptopyruvate sulfurtransferase SseA
MKIGTLIKPGRMLIHAIFALCAVQFFAGCGDDFQKPSTTQTGSALISADTLKLWNDAGKVNGLGYDRVVILDVTTAATYSNGHIPGALFLDPNDLSQSRTEGVGISGTEVLEGSRMDALVQKYGIDGTTTIVFTGSSIMNASRAYYSFRYWGFPKNRLKLLNGLNAAWTSGLTTTQPPAVAQSSYSVKNNRALRNDLRVSLSEMIDYADGKIPVALAVDVRSAPTAGSFAGIPGSTPGLYSTFSGTTAVTDHTVFEGRIRGAQALAYTTLYNGSNMFLPVDQLIGSFTAIGLDSTRTAYVYCRLGNLASIGFFVLDGILGWPAAVYDGSWSQWGQLSGNAGMKGQLNPGSPWRTDLPGRSEVITYNYVSMVSAPTFTGTGSLNDLTSGGSYTGTATATGPGNTSFVVKIDTAGAPDTFTWSNNGGSAWIAANVPVTGAAQVLSSGVTITFGSTSGHAVNDTWTFTAYGKKNIEQLTADGNICTATFMASGLTINSGPSACTALPNSFDTSANRIEETDAAYMGSGGSGGTSGGGAIPAGC